MSTEQLARNTDQTPQMEFVAEVKNSTKKVDINVLLDKVRALTLSNKTLISTFLVEFLTSATNSI